MSFRPKDLFRSSMSGVVFGKTFCLAGERQKKGHIFIFFVLYYYVFITGKVEPKKNHRQNGISRFLMILVKNNRIHLKISLDALINMF